MIAGMTRDFNIDIFYSSDEITYLKSGKFYGTLIMPAYLFTELISVIIDDRAVSDGRFLEYMDGTYFANVSKKFSEVLEQKGNCGFVYSPHKNRLLMHEFSKMSEGDKLYRHFLNNCLEDIKRGIRPRYDGLDKRKNLNTFLGYNQLDNIETKL